jgi:O-antigen/teichoic acid export membrane protein
MGSVKGRLAMGAVWLGGGRVLLNVLSLATTLVLARVLTPVDFGLVALAVTASAIVTAFSELSLSAALIQHPKPTERHYDTAFTLNFLRGLILALVMLALAYPIAAFYKDDRLVGIMAVLAGVAFANGLANPKLVVFSRALSFQQEFLYTVATKAVGSILAIAIALQFKTYWALLAGVVSAQVSGVLISYMLLPYLPRPGLKHTRELLGFSLWMMAANILQAIGQRVDTLILGANVSKETVGHYSFGSQIGATPVNETLQPLSKVLFPGFARLQDQPDRLREGFLKAQSMLVAFCTPIGVGFALVAEPAIVVTVGEKWLPAVPIVQAIAILSVMSALSAPVVSLTLATGQPRLFVKNDVITLPIRVLLMLGGALWAGVHGLLIGRILGSFVWQWFSINLAKTVVGASRRAQLLPCLRPVTAALFMAGVVFATRELLLPDPWASRTIAGLLTQIVIGGVAYLSYVLLVWVAQGRPAGLESEAFALANRLRARFTKG